MVYDGLTPENVVDHFEQYGFLQYLSDSSDNPIDRSLNPLTNEDFLGYLSAKVEGQIESLNLDDSDPLTYANAAKLYGQFIATQIQNLAAGQVLAGDAENSLTLSDDNVLFTPGPQSEEMVFGDIINGIKQSYYNMNGVGVGVGVGEGVGGDFEREGLHFVKFEEK